MKLWNDPAEIPDDWPASVVTMGVFDGVHLGHRELMRVTREIAQQHGLLSVVLTMWPNPAEVIKRGVPPTRLTTLEYRTELIESLGVDALAVLPFDEEVAHLSPEQFVSQVLSDSLHAAHVVVGANFRFGRKALGDTNELARLGERFGFEVTVIDLVDSNDRNREIPTSSTFIRSLIEEGDVTEAAKYLVRPHRVEGPVVSGDARGREMGFPTANIDYEELAAVPNDGVYVGRIIVDPHGPDREIHPAAISVGTNPTFDGEERRIEAFAFDDAELDLYGKHCAIDFVERLRDQEKYNTVEDLTAQVEKDVERSREILGM